MDEPGPTDVLSFPMDELRPGRHRGQPTGTARRHRALPPGRGRQAGAAGHSTGEELLLLTTHGILHLLGYDHAEPEEEKEMFELQRKLLLTFLVDAGTAVTAPTTHLVVVALGLLLIAGALSASEAALARRPRSRAGELVGEGRRGATALAQVVAEPSPALSVSTFLRVLAESGAVVAVTLAYVGVLDASGGTRPSPPPGRWPLCRSSSSGSARGRSAGSTRTPSGSSQPR